MRSTPRRRAPATALRRALLAAALSAAAALSSASAGDIRVVQKDKSFSQQSVRIRVGDTVTFVNADTVTHNVYSVTRGCEFELQTQTPGNSTAVPFHRACTAQVQCAIHPKMKLTVEVGGAADAQSRGAAAP